MFHFTSRTLLTTTLTFLWDYKRLRLSGSPGLQHNSSIVMDYRLTLFDSLETAKLLNKCFNKSNFNLVCSFVKLLHTSYWSSRGGYVYFV